MSLTSYAANFEDVLLWRALRDVERGFYLDIGAGDPLTGSATQLFYERGWHGVNLEPSQSHLRQLRARRPADINLALAAAAAPGSLPFYEVPGTPLSGFDAGLAQRLGAEGHDVVLRQAQLQTLDQVCEQHVDGPLHFVHIGAADVDSVLAGFDLARWRPWIVVLRAPAGVVAAALPQAGYVLAYQDGWKQYHVAPGRAALAAALRLPPHPDDDFVLSEGHALAHPLDQWRERTAAAETEAQASRQWAMAHVEEWRQKYAQLQAETARGDSLEAELERVRGVVAEQTASIEHNNAHYLEQRLQLEGQLVEIANEHQRELADTVAARDREHQRALHAERQLPHLLLRSAAADVAETTLSGVYASLSWRITGPLRHGNLFARRVAGWLRRLPGRARGAVARRVRRAVGAALRYVNQRPRLSFFLRRSISRLPFLVPLARAVHLRLRLNQANGAAAAPPPPSAAADGAPADLSSLPEAARRVFEDLRRSASQP